MVVYVNFNAALLKNHIYDYYSIASFILSRCECNYSVKKNNNNGTLRSCSNSSCIWYDCNNISNRKLGICSTARSSYIPL